MSTQKAEPQSAVRLFARVFVQNRMEIDKKTCAMVSRRTHYSIQE